VPVFTSAVSDLALIGPVIDLSVAVSLPAEAALVAAGTPVPAAVPCSMMVDTGASTSVIKPSVVASLGLQPVGITPVVTPTTSTPVELKTYAIRLLLPQGVVATVTAAASELVGQNIHGLIGRDLLKFGVLVYIGPENQFTLSF
jgi:hypothetical protein